MPEAAEFLAGFHFIQGSSFANYILASVTSTHEAIKRYHEYQYHINLIFKPQGKRDYEALFGAVIAEIIQEYTIYGIRNPYRCVIDMPVFGDILEADDGSVAFKLTGHSYRIYKTKQ